jgi:hypothetical protein
MKIKSELELLPNLIVLYVIIHKLLKIHFSPFFIRKNSLLTKRLFLMTTDKT